MDIDHKIEDVVELYINLRDEHTAITKAAKEKVVGIKEKMLKLEAYIQQKAGEVGVTSFKTDKGTAFLATSNFANVADWDLVLAWIKEQEAYDCLERRVNKTAIKEHIDASGSVPPGVTYGTKLGVSVRRPSKKG